MTVKEYLTLTLSKFGVEDETIDLIILNQELNPDDEATDIKALKKAMYKELISYIPLANVTEGGYSISWNWEALKLWYSALADELGINDLTKPIIRDKSHIW